MLSDLHSYSGHSPTKGKGQEEAPFPKGKGWLETCSLFYLLYIRVAHIALLLLIYLHFISFHSHHLPNTRTPHLAFSMLKHYLGIGINTVATTDQPFRNRQPHYTIINHIPKKILIKTDLLQCM